MISVGPTLKNVKSAIVNLDLELFYLNSIDTKTEIILENVKANRLIIVEPYYSGSVLKYLATYLKNNPVKILQIGVPNKFIDKYGSIDEITKFIRLDSQSIKDSIQDFVK